MLVEFQGHFILAPGPRLSDEVILVSRWSGSTSAVLLTGLSPEAPSVPKPLKKLPVKVIARGRKPTTNNGSVFFHAITQTTRPSVTTGDERQVEDLCVEKSNARECCCTVVVFQLSFLLSYFPPYFF